MGVQVQKVDYVCVIRVLATRHSWKKFLGSLAKLGNCYNWPVGPKSSIYLDVIWSRNLLIWSQTRYLYATKSGNSQLHNRDLWVFVIILAARGQFGPNKTLSRNYQFHWKPSDWLSWWLLLLKRRSKPTIFLLYFWQRVKRSSVIKTKYCFEF